MMRTIHCRLASFALLVVVLLSVLAQPAAATAQSNETPDITAVIEKYRAEIQTAMREQHIPGLSIVVVDDQQVLWQEGFGYTDTDHRVPVTPDTPFSIQSMSKSFTALTVLMAVQQGLLDLDTPLSTYLPDFQVNSIFEPDAADKINLRNLLSCTAGFTHEAPVGNNFVLTPSTFDSHAASIQQTWLKFPVGQMYVYSNLGIDLAGYIVQAQTGKPFSQYAQENLFTPLGMTNSTFDIDAIAKIDNRAIGHELILNDMPLVAMMPCGGVYTTAADMARYLQFHINGGLVNGQRVLSEVLLQTMYTPQFPASINDHYGLGIGVGRAHNARLFAHGGGGFGFLSDMLWYPELKLGIAWMSNSTTHNLQTGLKERILDDIIALDPGLYALRSNTKPPEAVRNDQGAGLLSSSALAARIQTLAPAPDAAQKARWQNYKGVYGLRYFNIISQLLYVDVAGDFVTLDGEKVYEFEPGLFFLPNGEALNLASDPPTLRNVPLKKLDLFYLWFLRGISLLSLAAFLSAILALPVAGFVARSRRKPAGQVEARGGMPGWLVGLLVWLAALLAVLSLGGLLVMPVMLQGGSLNVTNMWSQFPALMYAHLPAYNPVMTWYTQAWVLLPFVIFALTVAAGVGLWQAWRQQRGTLTSRVLLTVVTMLLAVMAILLW